MPIVLHELKTKGKERSKFVSPAEDLRRVKVKIVVRCHELDRIMIRRVKPVNRQMAKKFTINRQKRIVFYRQLSNELANISRQMSQLSLIKS